MPTTPNSDYIFVQVTAGSEEEAWRIAEHLVERKLVACAQMLPIRSCYTWQGEVTRDNEQLLFLKTRRDAYQALEAAVRALHSYEVPEILVTPILAGLPAYLRWMDEVVDPEPS